MSVLTEEKYFQGCLAYLDAVRQASSLPLLRKDFLLHPARIFETVGRADAVLLIVAALSHGELAEMLAGRPPAGWMPWWRCMMKRNWRSRWRWMRRSLASTIVICAPSLSMWASRCACGSRIPAGSLLVSESGIHDAEQVRQLADSGSTLIPGGRSPHGAGGYRRCGAEVAGRGNRGITEIFSSDCRIFVRNIDAPPPRPLTLTCPYFYNASVIREEGSLVVASPRFLSMHFSPSVGANDERNALSSSSPAIS